MKEEKKTKCINCKYWNTLVGCVVYSRKKREQDDYELKCHAYNKPFSFDMPPSPSDEFFLEDKSKFYRKGNNCKWYKFGGLYAIFNRIETFLNR